MADKFVPETGDAAFYSDGVTTVVKPDGSVGTFESRLVQEGKSLNGALAVLRVEGGKITNVTQLGRPARVSSKVFRTGYDRVFGKKSASELN